MSSPQENVAHARRQLEAFEHGDIEGVLALLHPDVEIFSPPELANSGWFRGREGYLQWTMEWFEAWEEFEIEAKTIEPIGDHHVLISVHQRGRGKGSGIEVEMEACYMGEIHDGLATRFHLYPTREQALEAARAAEGAAKVREP